LGAADFGAVDFADEGFSAGLIGSGNGFGCDPCATALAENAITPATIDARNLA
jgi:hypothetical protein